jgi:tRNA1Val (adenine37-N6)-methyltransferase
VNDETTTLDEVRRFGLYIRQPAKGYRFSLDALLLESFVSHPAQKVIDLGTGCGVISLVLAMRLPESSIVAVEKNPVMAELAGSNVRTNGLSGRVTVLEEDVLNLRKRFPVSSFDLVVSNPPFRSPHSGKTSPFAGRDAARHETTAGLADFLSAAKYLVKPGGRVCFIYHPSRLAEFIHCVTEMKLVLLRLRMVHGTVGAGAKIFLAELAKGRRGDVSVEAPLIVYDAAGEYTAEVVRIMGGWKDKDLTD